VVIILSVTMSQMKNCDVCIAQFIRRGVAAAAAVPGALRGLWQSLPPMYRRQAPGTWLHPPGLAR